MSPTKHFNTLLWFLRRPKLLPTFAYLAHNKLFPHELEGSGPQALAWCRERAIDVRQAAERLTANPLHSVREMHPDVFVVAEARARGCPFKMGGAGALDLLYHLAATVGARRVVETGVAYGWSSLALLLGIVDDGHLVSVDMPYLKMGNDEFVGCAVPDSLRARWKLMRTSDRQGLRAALAEASPVDLCHYDSDKSYRGRMWAYPLLWDALRPGGFFISDDISDNTAFRDFAASLDRVPVVVVVPEGAEAKYCGVISK